MVAKLGAPIQMSRRRNLSILTSSHAYMTTTSRKFVVLFNLVNAQREFAHPHERAVKLDSLIFWFLPPQEESTSSSELENSREKKASK